jgi:hypothetical protein
MIIGINNLANFPSKSSPTSQVKFRQLPKWLYLLEVFACYFSPPSRISIPVAAQGVNVMNKNNIANKFRIANRFIAFVQS